MGRSLGTIFQIVLLRLCLREVGGTNSGTSFLEHLAVNRFVDYYSSPDLQSRQAAKGRLRQGRLWMLF